MGFVRFQLYTITKIYATFLNGNINSLVVGKATAKLTGKMLEFVRKYLIYKLLFTRNQIL